MLRRNIGVKKVYNAYCKAEEFLFSFLFAVMVALVFSSAIARGIGKPLAWSLDVAQLLLCWTSLVGADVAFRHDKFIGLRCHIGLIPFITAIRADKIHTIVIHIFALTFRAMWSLFHHIFLLFKYNARGV